MHTGKYPVLSKAAFRVLAIPPSSASSELDISNVYSVLNPAHNFTGSGTVFDLIQIRMHYNNQ